MEKNVNKIRDAVREDYSKIVDKNSQSGNSGCCSDNSMNCCSPSESTTKEKPSSKMGYSNEDIDNVPEGSNLGLGCGNPQAIAALKKGEIVLDLGSGAGFDVFLAANQVGETGMVIGVDMTPKMISKARENAVKGNYTNVEFRLGEIENIPIADNSIDVIMSNCVINLSPEKQKVYDESFRVLKKGGRLAISDIIAITELPEEVKNDMALYSGCVSGASTIEEIKKMLTISGFVQINIKPKDESKELIKEWSSQSKLSDFVLSATIEAVKP